MFIVLRGLFSEKPQRTGAGLSLGPGVTDVSPLPWEPPRGAGTRTVGKSACRVCSLVLVPATRLNARWP